MTKAKKFETVNSLVFRFVNIHYRQCSIQDDKLFGSFATLGSISRSSSYV